MRMAELHTEIGAIVARSRPAAGPLDEVIAHLGAALMQTLPSDDQIIIGHVRAAHEIAKQMLGDLR